MKRDEAINILAKLTLKVLSKDERENKLTDWWGIDQEHPEFDKLPEALQSEILQFDEPQKYAMDEDYDSLICVGLRSKYLGVTNEYLSKQISEQLDSNETVVGFQEELFACPCCEFKTLPVKGEYDICPVCFWEDDGATDPAFYSSPNHMTLTQAQKNFSKFGAMSESALPHLDRDRLKMYSK
ncbi:CPCC family cysteine-rich protein [Paenibacillus chitinolyticus]|uniref:CPCC family cysteine-rich protein n=1 Tax=Paenibacillus chitinolyticus TaxID=79263 RepID=UPI003CFD6A0D